MRRPLLILSLSLACADIEAPATPPASTPDQPPVRPQPTGPCGEGLPTTPDPIPRTHTPRWAFEPWISKDISDVDDTYAFLDGFAERQIPVGVVVLDSPWETSYNSLIPNPVRYRDFNKMVAEFKARDVHTVLWLTAFINSNSFDFEATGDKYEGPSSNFAEAQSCNFFIEENRLFGWWKGKGGHLDFFNPKATAWWHWQLDKLLDAGVAGFKLDFGDSYVRLKEVKTAKGTVPHQEFSEAYYRDFYAHGVAAKGPEEFVTMVRPYDKSYDFEGRFFARKEHAPVTWVGDNRRDWVGLIDALDHMFRSAAAGYVVIGSDIGGYLDRDDLSIGTQIPADTEVFVRWTALGALNPFMQLHGRANSTPWTIPDRPDLAVEAWRYWGNLHHQLVPFFYSLAEEAYNGAQPIMRPVGGEADWPGDYRFFLGDALLVAPLLEAGNKRSVQLPPGARYLDWWNPSAGYVEGGTTVEADLPDITKIPLYIREGAIVPLHLDSALTGLGDPSSKGALSALVYPGSTPSRFVVHGEDKTPFAIEASLAGSAATVKVERAPKPVLLRVHSLFSSASLAGAPLAAASSLAALNQQPQGFFRDDKTGVTWARIPQGNGGTVSLSP